MSVNSRRDFLRLSLGGALGFCYSALATEKQDKAAQGLEQKPNIILIMADDIGVECFGSYGGTSYQTPVLDNLAKRGMRFEHCYSQPLCTPSRVQIMTGKYNFRNYKAFGILDPEETTFAHLLKKAGYKTCVVGKWQLFGTKEHGKWQAKGTTPDKAGFDEYCLWQIKEKGPRYADPRIEQNFEPAKDLEGQYGPDVFCDYICEFLERKQSDPFFVYYPMALVHSPFVPTPESPGWPEKKNEKDTAYFADMVAYMDKIVGRIVEKVEALGLDNTLILFTGDNGTHKTITSETRDGQVKGNKGTTTNAGTHVPLIAYWKGVTPTGQICDDLVDFSDFAPTFVEIAKVSLESTNKMDGQSFLPQLCGKKRKPRDWVFCHYDPRWGKWVKTRFARDKRWKLYEDGRFYDITTDPLEENPLETGSFSKKALEVKNRLEDVLRKMR